MTRLFVYGTLLEAAKHPLGDLLRDNGRMVGAGSIRARLYIIPEPRTGADAFPGAVRSRNQADRVYGELYQLNGEPAPLLQVLDDYENCSPNFPEPHEFQRRKVTVTLAAGTTLSAVAYLYNWDVTRARWLPDGRFLGSSAGLAEACDIRAS